MFCGGGGASMGYSLAGFEVIGVDINDQPDYPFEFHKANALTFDLSDADLVVASPPCQHHSNSWAKTRHAHKEYPDLIDDTRDRINQFNKPYVIENVQGANKALQDPLKLCGTMFDLRVFRHRLFEFGGGLKKPDLDLTCDHRGKRGITPSYKEGNMWTVCGTGGGWGTLPEWQRAMGIEWMKSKRPLSQAIPPAYTKWIGERVMKQIQDGFQK